jgi:hypothetical protein
MRNAEVMTMKAAKSTTNITKAPKITKNAKDQSCTKSRFSLLQ